MAIEHYDDLDVHHNQVKGFHPEHTAGVDPSGVTEGELFYDITNHILKYRDNSGTKTVMDLRVLNLIPVPTGDLNLNSNKIIGLAPGVAGTDAVNVNQLNNTVQGLNNKKSCKYATLTDTFALFSVAPTAVTWNNTNLNTVFSVSGVSNYPVGARLLFAGETGANEKNNGIYEVLTNNGTVITIARATDMDTWAEVPAAYTWVEEGGVFADTGWVCISNTGGAIGTTAITWTQFTGAGLITAGNGLSKTGNTLDVNVDGSSIEINADILRVKAGGITNAMLAGAIDLATKVTGILALANGGAGVDLSGSAGKKTFRQTLVVPKMVTILMGSISANTWTTVNHALGTANLIVQVWDVSGGVISAWNLVTFSVRNPSSGSTDLNNIEIKSSSAWASNTIQVRIIGLE